VKILAIRGCNLASLAGEFELDLAHGALGGAGVFAIVGPTGAGKSTLLDAMCVALFDRTPRLANRSTVVVGRGDDDPGALGAQDVRTLLRRGATAGWAEVDFESGDARRYRARWSVRRARGASDGNLQDQQVTLTTLDGTERFGGTKTETLKAIHQRLGLSFDQFRRSALLAQGEFATFLRAEGKDRSELLERMTGTEIYSKLSIAAHQRAALADQVLRDGRAAALAIAVLADDARAALEVEAASARDAVEHARARHAIADAGATWLAEAARRASAVADADAAHVAATSALAEAADDRAELALRRRAEATRPVWDGVVRLEHQLVVVRGEIAAAVDAEARAIVDRQRVAVRELDARFEQHAATAREITASDRSLADHVRRRGELAKQRDVAVEVHRAAVGKLDQAKRDSSAFQQRRGLTLDAARREEDAARLRCTEVDRLGAIAAEAAAATTAVGELAHQLAELAVATDVDTELRGIVDAEHAAATIRRGERERVAADLRRAAGYEHARAELVAGEPCPLCGADAHPWRDRGALDELVGEAEARFAEAARDVDAAVRELAAIAARDAQRSKDLDRLTAHRATAVASGQVAIGRWRDQLAALGELVLVDDPASAAARELAAERATAAHAKLEAARDARRQAEAVAKASHEAQAVVQARQADVEQASAKLTELATALATHDAAVERLRGERAGRLERHAELVATLAAVIAKWTPLLAAEPARALDDARRTLARTELDPGELAHELERCRRGLGPVAHALATPAAGSVTRPLTPHRADETAGSLAAIDRAVRDAERAVAERTAQRAEAERRCDALVAELAAATVRLDAAREAAGLAIDELRRVLAIAPALTDELAERLAGLDRAIERATTLAAERRRLVGDHDAARPSSLDDAERVAELAAAVAAAEQHAATLAATLAADGEARARRDAALAGLAAAEQAAEIDRVLGQVIGSHDGKLFRSFAQSLTLDALLAVANSHLEELAPRYQLERVPKHDLELQVIDRDLGDDVRSVQSLSGGESFLVSLALALGLSSMSAHDVRVRTLLIDEGFGTLDPTTLDSALAVLDALQATGRQVGVISHVPALVERVGAHIRVAPRGGGRSEVIVAQA
jgi:exonuclease SbcC